jgi:cold-inducible RNA-binding protein
MGVRLFVGNLPYDATEIELREYFAGVGPVLSLSMPVDHETGRKRGFAFVEFGEAAHAEEAVRRFNNQSFKGRPLAVNEARAREARPPGSPPRMGMSGPGGPSRPSFSRSGPPMRGLEPGINPLERARSDRPNRKFGPDAKPGRKPIPGSRRQQGEVKKRGPLPERSTGRYFGLEDEVFDDDDIVVGGRLLDEDEVE